MGRPIRPTRKWVLLHRHMWLYVGATGDGELITRTLCIVKPDVVMSRRIGAVLFWAESSGLRIVEMFMASPNQVWWETFYAEHKEKPFFKDLTNFMASGPSVFVVLEFDDMNGAGGWWTLSGGWEEITAVTAWRRALGPADSRKAAEFTVRGNYGDKSGNAIWRNAAHGSDSPEAAEREIALVHALTQTVTGFL